MSLEKSATLVIGLCRIACCGPTCRLLRLRSTGEREQVKWPVHFLSLAAVAGVVVLPFALLKLHAALEPVPAILLPSGAYRADVRQTEVTSINLLAWARSREFPQEWTRVEPARLIAPIPVQSFHDIAQDGFGLTPTRPAPLWVRGIGHMVTRPARISDTDAEETRAWLRARLETLGFGSDELRITRERQTIDKRTRRVLQQEVLHEARYRLD